MWAYMELQTNQIDWGLPRESKGSKKCKYNGKKCKYNDKKISFQSLGFRLDMKRNENPERLTELGEKARD